MRIARIITSDFLCWVPFIIICFLHYFEIMDATPQYGLFSIVILPINSVINPFLYNQSLQVNFSVAKAFMRRLRKYFSGKVSEVYIRNPPSDAQNIEMTEFRSTYSVQNKDLTITADITGCIETPNL